MSDGEQELSKCSRGIGAAVSLRALHPNITILDAAMDENLFGRWLKDRAWRAWFAFLAALFALLMTSDQIEICRRCAGRA